jgi:hypothetical protein
MAAPSATEERLRVIAIVINCILNVEGVLVLLD